MNHVVYIIFSDSLSKYYVGQTQHLAHRPTEHNSEKGNYTSKGLPWRLIQSFECTNRIDAVRLEKIVKSRGIKRYLQDHNCKNNLGM